MDFIKSHFFFIILLFGTTFQIISVIFGFDLSDEGFLMTLYRDFLTSADLRKTGSGYPLSCLIGWCCSRLTPDSIIAIRLWGVGMVTVLVIIIYNYLKDKFDKRLLAIGLLLMTFVMGNDPKPLGYNNITGFIATISIISIIEGCFRKNYILTLIGGILIGVNTFVRLPNVLEISFAIIPFLVYFDSWKKIIRKNAVIHSIIILIGAFAGGLLAWKLLVHLEVDKNVITFLKSITGQLNGDSSHSSTLMFNRLVTNYSNAVLYMLAYVCTVLATATMSDSQKRFKVLFVILILALFYCSIYIGCNLLGNHFYATYNGIGIFGAVVYFIWGNRYQRSLACAALLMSLVLPLGSDHGFVTMWNGTWMSLPIGLSATPVFVENIRKHIEIPITVNVKRNTSKTFHLQFSLNKYKAGIYLTCFTLILVSFVKMYHKCYYDPGDRFAKTVAIDSKMAKGIHTCKDKADRFNPLLKELRHYVKAGDTLLIYDWSPMLYFLTQTTPYAGISWPCVYYGNAYVKAIKEAEKKNNELPVVVLQYYRAVDKEINPDYLNYKLAKNKSERKMLKYINDFLSKNNYRKVWTNGWFEICIPMEQRRLQHDSNDW